MPGNSTIKLAATASAWVLAGLSFFLAAGIALAAPAGVSGKAEQEMRKEADKGSEQGQSKREEHSKKWWRFWE